MSRYIDADAFKSWVDEYVSVFKKSDKAEIKGYISHQPSLEIICCGECKHWERLNYEAPKEGWCDDQMLYSDGRWVDADDFCSYGEREGE